MTSDCRGMELGVVAASGRAAEGHERNRVSVWRAVVLLAACLCLTTGCSRLNRMICAMESTAASANAMASYMPIMANSAARMAYNSDRAIPKLDKMTTGIDTTVGTMESNIQNYGQGLVDNGGLLVQNLKAIRRELEILRKSIPRSEGKPAAPDSTREKLLRRMDDLQGQLRQLSARIDQMSKSPGPARTPTLPKPAGNNR